MYVLDGKMAVPAKSMRQWGEMLEDVDARKVGDDYVEDRDGKMERYSFWGDAVAGHQRMLERVRAAVAA